ncbi:MAG: DUF1501 domain-containing protein [Rubrivivax sp.]|nr:DUF1501 domain-containing protein [Rubrivivax sp.]
MNRDRRRMLGGAAGLGLLGAAGLLAGAGQATGSDYRALVVLFLTGGNDGHNLLVPTDAAYSDYERARQNLALARSSLATLPGNSAGHSFGLHQALAPLVPLYAGKRLAFIANVGPLVEPASARQVLDAAVDVPPFLLSHSDQVAMQQGWTVADDMSGWAGRALEVLPSSLRHPLNAVTLNNGRTLVQGKRSAVSFLSQDGSRYWGMADLARPQDEVAQNINRMAQWQFANAYEAEYARSFCNAVADSTRFTQALMRSTTSTGDFGSGYLGDRMRQLASLLPVFKSDGLRRQVFLLEWGNFDTHTGQRGSGEQSQDTQLGQVAKAVSAFDGAMQAAGLTEDVTLLLMSDFGRTLRPGSGGGSEHAWGNNLFALGGAVDGGRVLGSFPTLTLGGPDDGDSGRNGRMVPSTGTDQLANTLMQWLGLPANLVLEAFPNLVNFSQKSIPLLRA